MQTFPSFIFHYINYLLIFYVSFLHKWCMEEKILLSSVEYEIMTAFYLEAKKKISYFNFFFEANIINILSSIVLHP